MKFLAEGLQQLPNNLMRLTLGISNNKLGKNSENINLLAQSM